MKKTILLLCILGIGFVSCDPESPNLESKEPFSQEEGKQALENNSIEVLNAVESFRNDSALTELEDFVEYLIDQEVFGSEDETETEADYEVSVFEQKITSILKVPVAVKQRKISAVKLPSVMIKSIAASAGTALEDEYNEGVGVHTWNESTQDFDFVAGNNGAVVYTVTQNSKTATLTISDFTAYTHASGEEAPKSLSMSLVVQGTEIMSVDYDATIADSDYIPSNVTMEMSMGGFSYELGMTNEDDTDATFTQLLNIGETTILSLDLDLNGSYSDINATGDSDQDINTLLANADLTIGIGDTSITASGIMPEGETDLETVEEEVAMLNDAIDITIKSDNRFVANGEFYVGTGTDEVYHSYYSEKYYVFEGDSWYQSPDDAIAVFDTYSDYTNSEYYSNYYLYYYSYDDNEDIILESNVVTTNIWDYIDDNYTDGMYQGNYVYYDRHYSATQYLDWYEEEEYDQPDLKMVFDDGSSATLESYFEVGFETLVETVEDVYNVYVEEE